MSGDYTPVNEADRITLTASAAILAGQVVSISGVNTVAPAGAADKNAIGVAAFDAASGTRVTILELGILHETVTTGGVTAGQNLITGAGGTVENAGATPVVGTLIGVAVTTAVALAKCRWKKP
jgi:predicted RecA/RadA family phage recombinase